MAKRITEDRERGLRISELVEDGGWQISHLAREVGVDRKRIYEWMNGAAMNSTSLAALAGVLDTTREYLLTGEGPVSPATSEGAAATLDRLVEIRADQGAVQSDVAALILEIRGLREDLRSTQGRGEQGRGAR